MIVSVLIPANNERKNLEILVNYLIKLCEIEKRVKFEFVIVDDGSNDNTIDFLKKTKHSNFKYIFNKKRIGITKSYYFALKTSKGEFVIFYTADLQSIPTIDIPKLIDKVLEGFDIISGKKIGEPFNLRKLISLIYNFLVRFYFKTRIFDHNYVFCIKRDLLKKVMFKNGWHRFIIGMVNIMFDPKITEVSLKVNNRRFGKSHFKLYFVFKAFYDLVRVILFIKRYKGLDNNFK